MVFFWVVIIIRTQLKDERDINISRKEAERVMVLKQPIVNPVSLNEPAVNPIFRKWTIKRYQNYN